MSMENHGGVTNRGNFLICPPELSGSTTSSDLVVMQEEMVKEIMNSAYKVSLSHFKGFFNVP
jgi:hypothetical protein